MVQPSLMPIRFSEFELDEERFQLRLRDRRLDIRPKVFDLLVLLVRSRERVVLREELVLSLWGTTAVGPGSLSGLVNELRQVLGEAGRETSSIRTVHARGYQFVAKVEPAEGTRSSDATRSIDSVEEVQEEEGGSFGRALASIRASFEEAAYSGARAALVNGRAGSGRVALIESAVGAIKRAGFEIIRSPERVATSDSATTFVDRLLEAVVERHGITALQAMIPARSHELLERCAKTGSMLSRGLSDPLARRQYEGRIRRGTAELLRALACDRPIAVVLDCSESPGEDIGSALPALLNLLEDSRAFILGSMLPKGGKGELESAIDAVDSRVDWIEFSEEISSDIRTKGRDRLNDFLIARGIAALPRALADALVAHVRDDEASLESVASGLHAEAAIGSVNSNGSTLVVGASRMRRVEPEESERRSGFGTR